MMFISKLSCFNKSSILEGLASLELHFPSLTIHENKLDYMSNDKLRHLSPPKKKLLDPDMDFIKGSL